MTGTSGTTPTRFISTFTRHQANNSTSFRMSGSSQYVPCLERQHGYASLTRVQPRDVVKQPSGRRRLQQKFIRDRRWRAALVRHILVHCRSIRRYRGRQKSKQAAVTVRTKPLLAVQANGHNANVGLKRTPTVHCNIESAQRQKHITYFHDTMKAAWSRAHTGMHTCPAPRRHGCGGS